MTKLFICRGTVKSLLFTMQTAPLLASRRPNKHFRVLQIVPHRRVRIIPINATPNIARPIAIEIDSGASIKPPARVALFGAVSRRRLVIVAVNCREFCAQEIVWTFFVIFQISFQIFQNLPLAPSTPPRNPFFSLVISSLKSAVSMSSN